MVNRSTGLNKTKALGWDEILTPSSSASSPGVRAIPHRSMLTVWFFPLSYRF